MTDGPDNERNDKDRIRRTIREKRRLLDMSRAEQDSVLAQDALLGMPEFAGVRSVFCYLATAQEVRTDRVVHRCWQEGKVVCVPALRRDAQKYCPAVLAEDTELAAGPMGIEEPAAPEWIPMTDVDLAVVPGVAFDPMCRRVGHGGGHYDRMLAGRGDEQSLFRVGLAFEFQVLEEVPANEKDVQLDAVVTERRIIRARRSAVQGKEGKQ